MKVTLYDENKTYMFSSGELATPERMREEFPAIWEFPYIIMTDDQEQVLFTVSNLSVARMIYNVPAELDDGAAIEHIQNAINAEHPGSKV